MRSWLCGPCRFRSPDADKCLSQWDAAAINFADQLVGGGTYQSKPALPAVAGMQFGGRVCAVGAGVEMPIGTRVAGLGRHMTGAFAEYALIDQAYAFAPPDGLSAAQGACFTVAYQTAWFALHVRGSLRAGETVLVHAAAGGVGLASVRWPLQLVLACSGSLIARERSPLPWPPVATRCSFAGMTR